MSFDQKLTPGNRVSLELIVEAHASEMFSVLSDPEIYTYIPQEPPVSVAALAERFRRLETRSSADGFQRWLNWAVRRREDQQCVGWVQATIYTATTADFAFVFAPRFWGLGLAHEAAVLALSVLFKEFELRSLFATVDRRNLRSAKLLLRLGFCQIPPKSYPHGVAEETDNVFQLDRER